MAAQALKTQMAEGGREEGGGGYRWTWWTCKNPPGLDKMALHFVLFFFGFIEISISESLSEIEKN